MYNNGYFPFLFKTFSDAFYFYDIRDSLYIISRMPLFLIAYEITYNWIIINSLHAVYSLLLSLPLAHKLICFSFLICSIQPLYRSVSNT